MNYPIFIDKVEPIKVQDKLSGFLGAFENGIYSVSYLECVKLAGHSCPTVAGAYLMAKEALNELYPNGEVAQRGNIKVEMRDSKDSGVTGVVATAISFITGASDEAGFAGIAGNMGRKNLLSYSSQITREVKFTRLDTNDSVEVDYDPSSIQPSPNMQPLMGKMMKGLASDEEKKEFGKLWQERVEKILLGDSKALITISK
jgi:formylmethanofuran dehydrogenase subunit E